MRQRESKRPATPIEGLKFHSQFEEGQSLCGGCAATGHSGLFAATRGMAVAVVTERMVLAGKERSLMRLLKQLQSKAALHPGYITSVSAGARARPAEWCAGTSSALQRRRPQSPLPRPGGRSAARVSRREGREAHHGPER